MSEDFAWQYLIKLQKRAEAGPPVRQVLPVETEVLEISHERAARFIEEYEWLGNVGSAQRCFGLCLGGDLLAVACFTRMVSPTGFVRLLPNVPSEKVYQLCRGASAPHAPKWAGSRLISTSLRRLRALIGVELVVAYADPRAGEVGVVYQASKEGLNNAL